MKKEIAFFDFDGTITNKDSMVEFIKYSIGNFNYFKGLLVLSPSLIAYKLRIIPNNIAKEKLISFFFKGWYSIDFHKIAHDYSINQIDKIIRPDALKRIMIHKSKGHKVIVVSASMESWLKGWCTKNNVGLISTSLEIKDGFITGKFATKNCYGMEKVNRIKKLYKLKEFNKIYAYGDSIGDKEMLDIADEKYLNLFKE